MESGIKTVAKRGSFIKLTEKRMEAARMRHAWYRKQKQWEAFRLSLPEENRLER